MPRSTKNVVTPLLFMFAALAVLAIVRGTWAADEPEPLGGKLDFRPAKKLPIKQDTGEAERAIDNFHVAPGLKVKLWAAEPMLANPNALSVDEQGRVYVSEANRFKGGVIDVRSTMNWLEEDIASKSVAALAAPREPLRPGRPSQPRRPYADVPMSCNRSEATVRRSIVSSSIVRLDRMSLAIAQATITSRRASSNA